MRFILIIAVLAVTAAACNGPVKKEVKDNTPVNAPLPEEKKDTASYTSIQWIDSVKDYGKIAEGQKLEVAFRFKKI